MCLYFLQIVKENYTPTPACITLQSPVPAEQWRPGGPGGSRAPHLLQFILDTVSTQTLHCWRWRFSCWLGATRVGRQTGVGTREPAGHNREISHLISVEERTVNYCQCNPQGDDQWAMWELVSCLFVKIVRTTNLTTNREKWSETQMATFLADLAWEK